MNFYFSLVLLVSAASQINAAVNVTLFYETLCPYCVDFIRDQMYPTYKALGDHLYMDLVPFGKANWTENPWSITCQHGPRECHGNAIQACALERYKKPEMQINFITCLMSARVPEKAGAQCAKQLGYDYRGIEECAVGKEGQSLHIKHGRRTKAFRPPVKHVPFIVFNNYTFLLLFIFLLEAMAGILAYIYEEQVESELQLNLNATFLENYKIDMDKTKAIDDMQLEFKCCGAVRFEDWRYSKWFGQRTSKNLVPDSCCKTPSINCGVRDHPSNIQYNGCMYRLSEEIKSHLIIISAVGLGICILQIFGVIFSCCLYIKLKNKDDLRT